MSEFEPIAPPDSSTGKERKPFQPIQAEEKKRSRGCLVPLLIGILSFGCVILLAIVIILTITVKGSSEFMSGFKEEKDNIQEQIISSGESEKKVIIIQVSGIIVPGDTSSREHSSSESLIRQLRKAGKDPEVVAIILDMNTPGGAVTATDEVHNELIKLKRTKKVKLITCMRTIAASGGYYLAAATDHIVANRLTLTGSVGVIMAGYNYHALLEKIGVVSETYKSGKLKDLLNMSRPRKPEEAEIIQELINETFMEFANIVADGRDITLEEILSGPIGDASIFSGTQAKKLHLVDEIGYLEDAIKAAKRLARVIDPTVIRYSPHYSITDLFFSSISDSISGIIPGHAHRIQEGVPYYLFPLAM